MVFGARLSGESTLGEPSLQYGQGLFACPHRQFRPDRPCPALLLAARNRQWLMASARQFRGEGPDVIGDVNVLGKTPYHAVGLGKRCSSLEDQILAEYRREQNLQGLYNPDVLFQEVRGATDSAGGDGEGVTPVALRQELIRDVSHAKPGR